MSLITTGPLQKMWQDAQIYPEWATTKLWEYLFNRVIFNSQKWVVASQQPPTNQPDDRRRVDLIIQEIDSNAKIVGTLLFLEAKRASASPSEIETVEYQAYTAACAYRAETGILDIWTMTCVGSRARLWIFSDSSTYLIPFVPTGEGLADRSEYLEISDPIHGQLLAKGFDHIKKHMRPPREKRQMPPTPRPAHATLPDGWHDSEVRQLDAARQQDADIPTTDAMDFGDGFYTPQDAPEATYGLEIDTSVWDTGTGPSLSASATGYGPAGDIPDLAASQAAGYSNPDWNASESLQENSAGQVEAEGSSTSGGGRRAVEVKVTRHHRTMHKDELKFVKDDGHTMLTHEKDWVMGTRNGRTVWVCRGKRTDYWTKKLP